MHSADIKFYLWYILQRDLNMNINQISSIETQVRLKRPSHDKLKLANLCWQTQVGECERHNNSRQTCSKLATHVCQSFTRQIRVYQHENVGEKVGENRDKFYLSPTVCQHVCQLFVV